MASPAKEAGLEARIRTKAVVVDFDDIRWASKRFGEAQMILLEKMSIVEKEMQPLLLSWPVQMSKFLEKRDLKVRLHLWKMLMTAVWEMPTSAKTARAWVIKLQMLYRCK